MLFNSTILQISQHIHPIWDNVFFYLFFVTVLGLVAYTLYVLGLMKRKNEDAVLTQKQNVARVDAIRKDHIETLEKIRIEMLNREEERGRQWMESEKETLHVLNGVSNLLELSDKVDKVEFKKISVALASISDKILSEQKLMKELKLTEQKYNQLFQNTIVAISVHDVILDDTGKPCDYRFIEVNPAFEEITGLKAINIVGKTCLEVIPDVETYWIEIFGKVAVTGIPVTFENYNRSTGKNYKVTAYAPEPNKFIAISLEIA